MNYSEISKLYDDKSKEHRDLLLKSRALLQEMSVIKKQIGKVEDDLLLDFIGTESKIGFRFYTRFSGNQVNLKNTPLIQTGTSNPQNIWPCVFNSGDEIEVIKKNRVSVIIRCTKKFISKKEVSPMSEFRIPLDEFKGFIISNTDMYTKFKNWIKRTQSLDSLLG